MRIAAVLLSGFLAAALNAGAQVSAVRSVYFFPMGNNLEQYLAHRITSSGLFLVVTDPKKADAIFCDRLGPSLEARLNELYPETETPDAAEAKPGTAEESAGRVEQVKLQEEPIRFSSFGRGKGTTFLIDARNRTVLWSFYAVPKNSSPNELDRVAGRIVDRLKKDFKKAR
ncbi:MAG TPA: hypothetical protein PLA43_14945 [Bryobacteraceae bacterium]|nr:hypothetical protein [Bryobacteraceae bacterium]HOQ45933.1 hypothetical protein [Bryobacteraceae bacterium]HPU73248.1 hypothetical protein [Bryobacteraceae bacterium]